MKLYHATYKPLLESIKKFGLNGNMSKYHWEDSDRNYIYLAKEPEIAESYAESNDNVPEDWLNVIIIFEIDSEKLDQDKLEIDKNVQDNNGDTLQYKGIIPFSDLKVVNVNESYQDFLIKTYKRLF